MPDLRSSLDGAVRLGRQAAVEVRALSHIRRAGIIGGDPPVQTIKGLRLSAQYGQLASAVMIAASRHADRPGLIDELGTLSFGELDARSSALACALRARGLREGDSVGILCRNHRGLIDINFGAGKLGARILLLNTDFGGPQLRDVCEREDVALLVHDEEYNALVAPIEPRYGRVLAWTDGDPSPLDSLEAMISGYAGQVPAPPSEQASLVLLTSGTTGTPKGAPRSASRSFSPVGALLSKVPYRSGESTYVAAPMFHGLGYTQMALAVILGSTTICERRFKPERVLEAIATRAADGARGRARDAVADRVACSRSRPAATTRARCGSCSAPAPSSRLSSSAARERTIGEVLYNFYGSTEVAYATFATPEDLRAAPGTAGRVPLGAIVRLYDFDGRLVRRGRPDRAGSSSATASSSTATPAAATRR